ncbi:M14 family metallocarboxypeptidase [Paenibacillus sp. FSL H8-0537]|uniref:M14 family metallopeptidase n=1 Tax=Paenibacillus sp. FSL H8-0537 TaxID=2921399 RepID=UPI0031018AFD
MGGFFAEYTRREKQFWSEVRHTDNEVGGGKYGYQELLADCRELTGAYPFVTVHTIGHSVLGKPIVALRCGTGARSIHMNGAFHANEWITSALLMRFVADYAASCAEGRSICGEMAARLHEETTLWAVPMVNPDGVELAQQGALPAHPFYSQLMAWNEGRESFADWKANARGVDLNDQFPAHWEEECQRREVQGPGPRDYPGPYPLSEPEAMAMANLTTAQRFDLTVALHTQGEEIYWNYRGYEPKESEQLAERLGLVSGYKPVKLTGSDAGYKDWFIQRFRRPGFTIEAGRGENPLPPQQLPAIYESVKPLLVEALSLHRAREL